MGNKSLSHTHWKCQYHIIFIPKYRKKVLYGKVRDLVNRVGRRLVTASYSIGLCCFHRATTVTMYYS